jgi:hypothetical protein
MAENAMTTSFTGAQLGGFRLWWHLACPGYLHHDEYFVGFQEVLCSRIR